MSARSVRVKSESSSTMISPETLTEETSQANPTNSSGTPPTSRPSKTPTWGDLQFWKSSAWKSMQPILNDDGVIPQRALVFRPFIETPLQRVKVVILAPEPYSLRGIPDGLAYSCMDPIVNINGLPQVLQNIFTELVRDVGVPEPSVGSLRRWARQGVLLWNTSLTVRRGHPHTHMQVGWDHLTREVLDTVYLANPNAVFVFWDAHVKDYMLWLPKEINKINTAGPAMHSAYSGFFNSKPFSKINDILRSTKQEPIDWRVY